MSLNKRNTARKVPPKKIKDNVNSALKTVTKPEDAFSKADSSIRSGNPVPPPVAKELLSNFYDLVLCKLETQEPPPKVEEVAPEIAEARFSKPRPSSKKKPGSAGLPPIPCTSDLCSKVRQLVQMNNKVQNFKKKFLEVPSDIVDEKRAMQQKKLKIGNEYSKRNTSKKVASKIDKTQKTGDQVGCGCETIKKVTWGPEQLVNQSNDPELKHSHTNFVDCLDDDPSSSLDSGSDYFQHDFRKERHYETDYVSCVDTDYANSSRNSSSTFVHQSSSARMLIHFRELLSMHILPKNADDIRCSILSDEDIAFLQTLVEADERYHCLKKEDHNLLKDILMSHLQQIETQERILAETLSKLRQKSGSSENISGSLNAPNKEKAEQPLEMSEKKEPPYEVILRDLLKVPEQTSNLVDKEILKSLKTSKSAENANNESAKLFSSNDLENNSFKHQVQITEDDSNDSNYAILDPLITYPSSPDESPKYPRRSEGCSIQITEANTEPYEDPELVVPLLDLEKLNEEPITGFFKRSFNWFSAREPRVCNKKNTSSQKKERALSARMEKIQNSERKTKRSLSARNKSGEIKGKDLNNQKVICENQSKNSQDCVSLFGKAPLLTERLETSLDDLKKHIDILEVSEAKEIVDNEIIKSTAKLINDAISETTRIYSRPRSHKPSRDQETNTEISAIKNIKYFTISFEYMMFLENLASIEVCPLNLAIRGHIAKEFRMKHVPVDELNNAGEFFILNSESSEITIEKTNFQTLHKQPEKLSKLLQPMYKQPIDKGESASKDGSNYKYLYPWQISDYPIPDDIMIQNVICCLFKTWASHPELYKQSISNCKILVPQEFKPTSKDNTENEENSIAVLENKPIIGDQFQDNNQQNITNSEIKSKKDVKRRKLKKNLTPKNLLVCTAQFLLFTALVLGLTLFQYKCLDM